MQKHFDFLHIKMYYIMQKGAGLCVDLIILSCTTGCFPQDY